MQTEDIRDGKVLSVQLLRGCAAALVTILHFQVGFASYVGDGFPFGMLAPNLGALAVAVFFVISGYVMVVSSRRLFAARRGAGQFIARRLIRVIPPCWIATLIMVAALTFQGREVSLAQLLASLAFVPLPELASGWTPGYVLWPAWSLFFELEFYALFALAMLAGRSRGRTVALATAGLIVLATVGFVLDIVLEPGVGQPNLFIRPVLLLFIPGMAIGLWREHGGALPPWLRWACLVAGLVCLPQMTGFANLMDHPLDYVVRAGLPAVLIAIAVMAGPLRLPLGSVVSRFGDISFALYLLHIPVAHFWIGTFRSIAPLGPWLFLLSGLVLAVAASLAFYLWIERPLTRRLQQLLPAL